MKLGEAFYCDECGCEIVSGDVCLECNPIAGAKQIVYTFIADGQITGGRGDIEPAPAGQRKISFIPWIVLYSLFEVSAFLSWYTDLLHDFFRAKETAWLSEVTFAWYEACTNAYHQYLREH